MGPPAAASMGPVPPGIRAGRAPRTHGWGRRAPRMPSEARPSNTIGAVRAPVDHIAAPAFPRGLQWVNGRAGGHPMLLEFWDFCRPQSIRTLPYMRAWNERYPDL